MGWPFLRLLNELPATLPKSHCGTVARHSCALYGIILQVRWTLEEPEKVRRTGGHNRPGAPVPLENPERSGRERTILVSEFSLSMPTSLLAIPDMLTID